VFVKDFMRNVNSPVKTLMKELKLEVLVDKYSPAMSAESVV